MRYVEYSVMGIVGDASRESLRGEQANCYRETRSTRSPFPFNRISVTRPNISGTPCSLSLSLGRHHWSLLIAILSLFNMTEAYLSVSMSGMCKYGGTKSLKLSPETALTLLLDTSNSIHSSCKIELSAPDSHSISLLFERRNHSGNKKDRLIDGEDGKQPKCPLVVSFPLLRPEEVKMCLDLCSEEAFKSVEHFTDLLPPKITLEWNHGVKSSSDVLASEIVVAAVGRGRDVCSRPDQFSCRNIGYPVYCISKELVCDGKRNCPFEGSDEDRNMCSSGENYDKVGFGDVSHIGRGWEFIASEFLKKLNSKDSLRHFKKSDTSSSTEKSMILWSDEGNPRARDSENLPDVLKHYGPWGYLMLGMLICGTVLMFCGLWECCCRRPKALVSNAVGPALLIINQGAQQNESEAPSTPGPPRYEDLDQPPSYSALFPSTKVQDGTNPLPITLPLVNSLSNLLINTSSSQTNSVSNGQSRNSAIPPTNVFTIDMPNGNNVDIPREINDTDARPK